MRRMLFSLGVFGFGLVAGLNLATMYPNETYNASYGQVAFAGVFGAIFIAQIILERP